MDIESWKEMLEEEEAQVEHLSQHLASSNADETKEEKRAREILRKIESGFYECVKLADEVYFLRPERYKVVIAVYQAGQFDLNDHCRDSGEMRAAFETFLRKRFEREVFFSGYACFPLWDDIVNEMREDTFFDDE
jgi:hypothetical protein